MSEKIIRAEHAKRLLADPMLADAFASVVKEAIDAWANTPEHAVDTREGLWRMVQTIHRTKSTLLQHMITGQIAAEPPVTRV